MHLTIRILFLLLLLSTGLAKAGPGRPLPKDSLRQSALRQPASPAPTEVAQPQAVTAAEALHWQQAAERAALELPQQLQQRQFESFAMAEPLAAAPQQDQLQEGAFVTDGTPLDTEVVFSRDLLVPEGGNGSPTSCCEQIACTSPLLSHQQKE